MTPTTPAGSRLRSEDVGWWAVCRVAVARSACAYVATLLLWSVAPLVLGWTPHLVMSGSMAPRIGVGDVVVSRPVDPARVAPGAVVTVADPDHPGRTRTHRVVRTDAAGRLVLRGDANDHADSDHVSRRAVDGVGVLRVPWVGRPVVWLREGDWLPLGLTLLAATWCLLHLRPTGGSSGPRPRPGSGSRRGRRRTAALTAVGAVVTFGVLTDGGSADAAFRTAAANPTSSLVAAADFHPYATSVSGDGPSLYWRLSEANGTAVSDSSGNSRTGTISGTGYTRGQAGALASETTDKALGLTAARVTANASVTGPVTFSVEAWVKTTSAAGGRVIGFGNGSGSTASTTTDRQLYVGSTGHALFGVGSAKTAITSPGKVTDGAWHQLVGTCSGTTTRLYVDGQLAASGSATPVTMTGYWRAGGETLTGWTSAPTSTYLTGTIDEVAVYPTTLSSAQVQDHYTAATTP